MPKAPRLAAESPGPEFAAPYEHSIRQVVLSLQTANSADATAGKLGANTFQLSW